MTTELQTIVSELIASGWNLEDLSPAKLSGIERGYHREAFRYASKGQATKARRCTLRARLYKNALGENYVPLV